jgi:hypothetical protein
VDENEDEISWAREIALMLDTPVPLLLEDLRGAAVADLHAATQRPGPPTRTGIKSRFVRALLVLLTGELYARGERDRAIVAAFGLGFIVSELGDTHRQEKGGRATAARPRPSRGDAWLAELSRRMLTGRRRTKAALYAEIEREEGLRPGTVKKAVLRAERRADRK